MASHKFFDFLFQSTPEAPDAGFLLRLYAETARFLQQQAWTGDWRVVVICPHRELQFGALTPVQEFVERRVLWVELQPRDGQPPITPLILWPPRRTCACCTCNPVACIVHADCVEWFALLGVAMPSLQIRDVPAPLHQLLIRRARAHKRSLGQQALHDLEQLAGGDALQRRRLALARLSQLWEGRPRVALTAPPEELIRADRER